MDDSLSICSLNCQGLGDFKKRRDVLKYLRTFNYSIVCLQDTHFTKCTERLVQNEWGYKAVFSSFESNSRGVALLFNNNFEFKIHNKYCDQNGNVLIIDLELSTRRVTLVTIYGPNRDDPVFYTSLFENIYKFNNDGIIIVGDWNLLLNPEIDGYNYKHINNPQARQQVLNFMNHYSFYDVWREENQEERIFTWRRKINNNDLQMGRLDFFLVSESLLNFTCKEKIKSGYRSDHSIIELTLTFNKALSKTKTFWKFNNSLLYNKDFVNEIRNSFLNTKRQYAATPYNLDNIADIENEDFVTIINPQLFLEMILLNARSTSISMSSAIKKKERAKTEYLEKQINELEFNDPILNQDEIIKLKNELKEFREQKLKGSLVRSKAKWIEEGEKPSRYFCNLENRNFVSKRMSSLIDRNNIELLHPQEIKNEVLGFYKKLYSSQETQIENINLNDILKEDTPKLDDFQAMLIEGPITFSEASDTLKKMQSKKSPGSSGFTSEFFKFFWKDLGIFVVNSINFGFIHGELSSSQKEGIITCVPKGNKNKKYIKIGGPFHY